MRQEVRHHGALARLAAKQHGVVAHRQLLVLGYSTSAIERAIAAQRLHRVHRGSYSVGHPGLSRHGRCLAAVLACGRGALLSHESAAWLWGLRLQCPARPEVTMPARGHTRSGIWIHHSTILEEVDATVQEDVPTTSVPRSLLDLAARHQRRTVEGMLERADRLDVLDIDGIDSLLARCGSHPGSADLRRAADLYRGAVFTRARTERLFLALVRKARLPRPATNTYVAGHEIDAYWARERFAVEIDGFETHGTRAAFERDPVRQEELKLAGIDSVRFTARRIERDPNEVAKRLRALLTQRRRQLGD
jgi:very-short-patch-repair endonuclease